MQSQPSDESIYRDILPKQCAAMAIRSNEGIAVTIVHARLTGAMANFAATLAQTERDTSPLRVLGFCRMEDLPSALTP